MSDILAHLNDQFKEAVDQATDPELSTEEATAKIKIVSGLAQARAMLIEQEPDPEPVVPTTIPGKISYRIARIWDNETTRVFIKAGGAFAGVGLVVWSTVHKDHVIERQAMTQANQRND